VFGLLENSMKRKSTMIRFYSLVIYQMKILGVGIYFIMDNG